MIDIVRLKFEETTESPDTDFEAIISHHFNHYRILAGQGKADKALEILKTILKINPNNIAVLIEMGMEFSKQKKLEKALAAFKRVLEIDQNSVGAWNNIGVVLIKQGKLKEALKAFNKVLEIDPGNTITQSNKKLLLTKLRRNPR